MALLAPKPETATVARRVIAALADHFLLSILIGTMSLLLLPKWIIEDSKLLANLVGAGITAIYFLIAESIFATSLGKAAMRIHIADARTGRRPTIGRVSLRVAAYTIECLNRASILRDFVRHGLDPIGHRARIDHRFGHAVNMVALLCYLAEQRATPNVA